jgi:hypothetical protein
VTTLDARARRASQAIAQSVDAAAPFVPFDALVRRHFWGQIGNAVAVGALIIAFLFVGALLRGPDPESEVTDVDPPEPVVEEVVPVVPEPSDSNPVERGDATPATTLPPSGNPVAPPVVVDPGEDETPPTTVEEDTTPPDITITSPSDGDHVEEKMIRFAGTTEPGATVAAGRYVADVDPAGNWSIVLVLSPGANGARFTATDAAGNTASARITVHYDVPAPPPPPEDDGGDKEPKPPKVEFTAHAKYGSCDSSPPFDIYWGTAEPGSTVSIISEYGSGSVRANDEGGWEVKVYFPEAPKGKVFVVKVKDEFGHKKTFEFVSHAKN